MEEAVDALAVKPDGVYVDATFGRGGHSALILRRLGAAGRLIALDRDPQAVAAANAVADGRLAVRHAAFSGLLEVLHAMGIAAVDGVLLDLGVSSPQLDDPARGMSFRFDAPLDMRMDTSCGMTAAQWLAQAGQREIEEVIRNYGEERFAAKVAKAIVAARGRGPVTTTRQLAEIVAQAVPTREQGQHPATRSFQAVRIFVNQELEELSLVLPQCIEALRPAGRLVVICFHSLEDRLVKRFLRGEAKPQLPSRLPLRARELPQPRIRLVGKAARPDAGQIADNPRARSAIMRVAERI